MEAVHREVIVFCKRCLEGRGESSQLNSGPVVFIGAYQIGAAHTCCDSIYKMEVKFKCLKDLKDVSVR